MAKAKKSSEKKSKPRGEFKFILAMDCETTGLAMNADDASAGHQAISWGLIVADAKTFKPIDEKYVEIKWNADMKAKRAADPGFGKKAETIHGLSYDYLDANGIDEEQAVLEIGQWIFKYWGTTSIRTLGHNVHLFDMPFFRAMFRRYEVKLSFGNRHYDTNSLGFGTTGAFNSDDLFTTMGFEKRDEHNALEDAKMSLGVYQITKKLWKSKIGLLAYE